MHRECRHILPSGCRCHAAALRDMPYCYYHDRLHRIVLSRSASPDVTLEIPVLEDRTAIQLSLSDALNALASGQLEPRRARLLLYGLQIASYNLRREPGFIPDDPVESFTQDQNGHELAPETLDCDIEDDCDTCPMRDSCGTGAPPLTPDDLARLLPLRAATPNPDATAA